LICHLLDVNVLIALQWEGDRAHSRVRKWFLEVGRHSFATCALTQAGFARVLSNPALTGISVEIDEAQELIQSLTRLDGHRFWPIDLDLSESVALFTGRLHGFRQVTDAYLLGLAIHRKGTLVTLDKAIPHLAGHEFRKQVTLL
jgi:toxin-antitoxin system PIN domain toxin